MRQQQRKIRQEKLARLFYEMGMDVEVVSKISGVEMERIIKLSNKSKIKDSY